MALQFLGKDPESEYNGSPTVWDDGDCYVIQGWRMLFAGRVRARGRGRPHLAGLHRLRRPARHHQPA